MSLTLSSPKERVLDLQLGIIKLLGCFQHVVKILSFGEDLGEAL
jgi:hypothetical protein